MVKTVIKYGFVPEDHIVGKPLFIWLIAIASKGRGKSGGARIITNVVIIENTVYLLNIYDKSEKENLTDKELSLLLKSVPD